MAATLKALAHTQEVRTYLESRHPQNDDYRKLRVELEALRASAENEIVVDAKLLLKPGQSSPELPKVLSIIARDLDDETGAAFGETLARLGSSELYVEELVPVIKAAQERAGLKPDGVIGPRTVAGARGNVEGRPPRQGADRARAAALAAVRPRQHARLRQPARLHGELHRGRRAEAVDARRRRQAVQPDQLLLRRDRAGRLQPLLGRAAVDHRQRDAAAPARRSGLSRPRRLRGHRRQGKARLVLGGQLGRLRREDPLQRAPDAERGQCAGRAEDPVPQQARHLHARHAVEEPVRARRARSAMAASACRTRAAWPPPCSARRSTTWRPS